MEEIAKYTPAGLTAKRDALVPNATPLALATFKISASSIDLSGENVLDDLPDFWIEEPISSYRIIGSDRLEFRLFVSQEKATKEGHSFALYLEDGTAVIVGTPPNFYNAGIAQEYLVQVQFVNSNAGEFSFVWIPADLEEIAKNHDDFKDSFRDVGLLDLTFISKLIGQRADYLRTVIPLVELTDGEGERKSHFSYTSGTFELIRMNGAYIQSPVMINIKSIKKYNSETFDLHKIHFSDEFVKPCTFMHNGKKYGGLEVYYNVQAHSLVFTGVSNCQALGYYDYYDTRGSVTNEEIHNSIEFM